MADLNQNLTDSATSPKSMTQDGRTATAHDLKSQIEAAKYVASTKARSRSPLAGMTLAKLRPHGSMLAGRCD